MAGNPIARVNPAWDATSYFAIVYPTSTADVQLVNQATGGRDSFAQRTPYQLTQDQYNVLVGMGCQLVIVGSDGKDTADTLDAVFRIVRRDASVILGA